MKTRLITLALVLAPILGAWAKGKPMADTIAIYPQNIEKVTKVGNRTYIIYDDIDAGYNHTKMEVISSKALDIVKRYKGKVRPKSTISLVVIEQGRTYKVTTYGR